MPAISNVVKDSSGAFASRLVRAYRRDTGAFVGQTLSDPTTGAYSITTADTSEHFVLAHDTANADPYWNNVVFATHLDGANNSTTFTDLKGKTITRVGTAVVISTTNGRVNFGGSSALFNGTASYLSLGSSADFNLAPGDFHIGFHAYYASAAGNQAMFEIYVDANNRYNVSLVSGNIIFYSVLSGAGSIKITTTAPSVNTWHYIELTKTGSTFTLRVDGVSVGTSTTASYHNANSLLTIGYAGGGAGSAYAGHVDDFVVTKGVARPASNPIAAFLAAPVGGTENLVALDLIIPV